MEINEEGNFASHIDDKKKNILKKFIFYILIFGYMIFGGISSYNFINDFMIVQKSPKTLLNLYIERGDENRFILPILISFIFNGTLIYYLTKYFSIKDFMKYISIFLMISLFFILLKQTGIWHYESIPNSYIASGYFLYVFGNILFANPYAIQNQAIFAFWILLLYPFHGKIFSSISKTKLKIGILVIAFIVNFFVIMWFFPNYLVRPIV